MVDASVFPAVVANAYMVCSTVLTAGRHMLMWQVTVLEVLGTSYFVCDCVQHPALEPCMPTQADLATEICRQPTHFTTHFKTYDMTPREKALDSCSCNRHHCLI